MFDDIINLMKAFGEIGLKKSIKFVFYSLFTLILNTIFLFPFRSILLKLAGSQIGKDTILHSVHFFNHYQHGFKNLIVGKECFIGDDVSLDLSDQIILEDQVTLSNRVLILTHTNVGYKNHPLQKYFPKFTKKILIKKGSFIGAGAIILPGITIGKCVVIGAGAVVTKNISDWVIAVGSPAHVVKRIR